MSWRNALVLGAILFCSLLGYWSWSYSAGRQLSFYKGLHCSVSPNASSVSAHGLRLTIREVKRIAEDQVEIHFALEWIPCPASDRELVFFHPANSIQVRQWNEGNDMLRLSSEWVWIEKDFRDANIALYQGEVRVRCSDGSEKVDISIAGDLVTNPIAIPKQ